VAHATPASKRATARVADAAHRWWDGLGEADQSIFLGIAVLVPGAFVALLWLLLALR